MLRDDLESNWKSIDTDTCIGKNWLKKRKRCTANSIAGVPYISMYYKVPPAFAKNPPNMSGQSLYVRKEDYELL